MTAQLRYIGGRPEDNLSQDKARVWQECRGWLESQLLPTFEAVVMLANDGLPEGVERLRSAKLEAVDRFVLAESWASQHDQVQLQSAWSQVLLATMQSSVVNIFLQPKVILGESASGASVGYLDFVLPEVVQEPIGLFLHSLDQRLPRKQGINLSIEIASSMQRIEATMSASGHRSVDVAKALNLLWKESDRVPLCWRVTKELRSIVDIVTQNIVEHGESGVPVTLMAICEPDERRRKGDLPRLDEGIREISRQMSTPLFAPYVKIVATKFEGQTRRRLLKVVDEVVDKELLFSTETPELVLKDALFNALKNWSLRTKRPNPIAPRASVFRCIDSPAMRRVEAAVGADVIERIGDVIAAEWASIVEALSGGYSGAFLLSFADAKGHRRVVCKASRIAVLIQDEVDRTRQALSFPCYVPFLPPVADIQEVNSDPRVTFVQLAAIEGTTLEARLLQGVEMKSTDLQTLTRSLREIAQMTVKAAAAQTQLPLTSAVLLPEDVLRFEASLPYLKELRAACVARGNVADEEWNREPSMQRFLERVVRNWTSTFTNLIGESLPHCWQHGDLNLRNVLVGSDGRTSLIDFARFDQWPIGYDLVRVELQVMLRLLSRTKARESFSDDLSLWWRFWIAYRDAGDEFKFPSERDDIECVSYFLNVVHEERCRMHLSLQCGQSVAMQITNMLRCFDAIKMCSYQDATSFKRLFFLLVALDCARSAGAI